MKLYVSLIIALAIILMLCSSTSFAQSRNLRHVEQGERTPLRDEPFGPSVADENTLALYHLDEIDGNIAHDATGEYDMQLTNGAQWFEDGRFDGAIDLTAFNAGLESDDWEFANGSNALTIEAWVFIPEWNNPENWDNPNAHIIASRSSWREDRSAFRFQFNYREDDRARTGALYALVGTDEGFQEVITEDDEVIPLETWTPVALTWASGQHVCIWVDGELVGESEDALEGVIDCDERFRIGDQMGDFNSSNIYIDELRISNVVRSFINAPEWWINIAGTVDDYGDTFNYVGGAEDADFGFDLEWDIPEPEHAPENYISVSFQREEWEHEFFDDFMSDVVPLEAFLDEDIVWSFTVETDQSGEWVSLNFQPGNLPVHDFDIMLVDGDDQYNLREDDFEFVYRASRDEVDVREFELVLHFIGLDREPIVEVDFAVIPEDRRFLPEDRARIEWVVNAWNPIVGSVIYFSPDDGENWEEIGQTDGDDFNLNWQAPNLYSPYCRVQVEVTDERDQVGTGISERFAVTPDYSEDEVSDRWNIMSIPLSPENGNVDWLFSDDFEDFDADYWFFSFTQRQGAQQTLNLEVGPGYWIATTAEVILDMNGTALIDTLVIDLEQGWNMIGAPFLWSTPLESFHFRRGNAILTIEEAVEQELVLNMLYGYWSDNNFREEDALFPWRGYFFIALEEVELLLVPVIPGDGRFRDGPDEVDEGTLESWYITLLAETPDAGDLITSFGADTSATDGFDAAFDCPEPPNPPGGSYVTNYFEHPNWLPMLGRRFNKDIKHPDNELEWIFTVETSDEDTVILSWPDIEAQVPEGYLIILEDMETGEEFVLQAQESYSYTSEGIHRFRAFIEMNAVSDRQAITPEAIMLNPAYPNPFNSSTSIGFSLPTPCNVVVKAYDLSGREVSILANQHFNPGHHNISWDASKLPSGTYMLRLNTSGAVYTTSVQLLR